MAKIAKNISEHSLEVMAEHISEILQFNVFIQIIVCSIKNNIRLKYYEVTLVYPNYIKIEKFDNWDKLVNYYKTLMAMDS